MTYFTGGELVKEIQIGGDDGVLLLFEHRVPEHKHPSSCRRERGSLARYTAAPARARERDVEDLNTMHICLVKMADVQIRPTNRAIGVF